MLGPKLTGEAVSRVTLVRGAGRTDALAGQTVAGVEARGKNLLIHVGDHWTVHVHLKMNGRVRLYALANDPPPVAMSAASLVLETARHRVVVYEAPIARLLRTRDLTGDFHLRDLGPDLLGPSFALD